MGGKLRPSQSDSFYRCKGSTGIACAAGECRQDSERSALRYLNGRTLSPFSVEAGHNRLNSH